jgi:hypothetical protein
MILFFLLTGSGVLGVAFARAAIHGTHFLPDAVGC